MQWRGIGCDHIDFGPVRGLGVIAVFYKILGGGCKGHGQLLPSQPGRRRKTIKTFVN